VFGYRYVYRGCSNIQASSSSVCATSVRLCSTSRSTARCVSVRVPSRVAGCSNSAATNDELKRVHKSPFPCQWRRVADNRGNDPARRSHLARVAPLLQIDSSRASVWPNFVGEKLNFGWLCVARCSTDCSEWTLASPSFNLCTQVSRWRKTIALQTEHRHSQVGRLNSAVNAWARLGDVSADVTLGRALTAFCHDMSPPGPWLGCAM
jgi:hypothetical protein